MQTNFSERQLTNPRLTEAESILRTRSAGRGGYMQNTIVPMFCAEMDVPPTLTVLLIEPATTIVSRYLNMLVPARKMTGMV